MSEDLGDACEPISMIIRRCSIQLGIPASVLASLRPGPNGEPARCVVVPREPTEAMLAAAFVAAVETLGEANDHCQSDEARSAHAIRPLYRAMLAAAQAPGHD